jgi:hypothetical protein
MVSVGISWYLFTRSYYYGDELQNVIILLEAICFEIT